MPESLATGLAVALWVAALPYVAASCYLGVMAVLARGRAPQPRRAPRSRFDVLVPAHDEESNIRTTIESLQASDYPPELYRITVIADNCRDETAARARECGADVLVRDDDAHRGKGYALAHGFAWSVARRAVDAVVVVDADTTVSANLLSAFDAALGDGHRVLQARYGVRNPRSSWRTRLVTIAFALVHDVRSLARDRLGLSCGLRGNGMCFHLELLRRLPYNAVSIVEDVEYGVQLGLAGIRVAYVADAEVRGDMPEQKESAAPQRQRWEAGRAAIRRRYALPLLRAAVQRRSAMLLDLSCDLLMPPLSRLVAFTAMGWLLAALAVAYGVAAIPALASWTLAALGLAVYVVRGCALTGAGGRALLDLLWAPVYMLWKLGLWLRGASTEPRQWVRTERSGASRGTL